MRAYPVLLLLLLLVACKKKYTYTCDEPQLVLEQRGYDSTEWDTIIIKYYDKGYNELIDNDTFVAENTDDVLLLDPGSDTRDLEIYLLSVNKTYRLYDIQLDVRTYEDGEYSSVTCYSGLSYNLDGERFTHDNTAVARAYLYR